jgi:hypothetical protein
MSRLRPLISPLGLLAALALSAPSPARAQADLNAGGLFGWDGSSSGVPAFSFLKLPVSARSIGLSARTLTTDEEASMLQGNPAGLALVADYFYSLSHAEILGEFRHENMALAFPTRSWGGFGLAANVLAATAFEDARDIEEEPAAPSAYDMAFSLAHGRNLLGGRLAAGARLDLVRSAIDGATAHGYAATFGALFFLAQDWRLGAALHNLSHGVRYEDRNGEGDRSEAPLEPLPLGLGLELGKPLLGSRWSFHAGLHQGNEGILKYYAGGEFRLWRYLLLRMGWDGSSQDRELGGFEGFAAGTGFKYDRLTLDYGFKSLGPLGSYHALTLNYSRKARFRALDAIHMEKALEAQRKGRYAKALSHARKAVAANPYNFKAQALAKQLEIEIERLDETAVSLFFTGGTEGSLTSHWRDGRPLGGLARRKSKLVELLGAGGKSLVLDAGNLTHASSRSGEVTYVQAAYAQMPYDAVNVGSRELALGPDAWRRDLPWLATQRPVDGLRSGLLAEKALPLKGGVEVVVYGALDPEAFRKAGGQTLGGKALEAAALAVRRRSRELAGAGDGKRIQVLLFQGGLLEARRVAELAPELDAIIVGGEAQALGSPMKAGRTLLCSPGTGGTHIGHLTLLLDKHGGLRSFRHFLVPLDASIPEDPGIRKLLAPVTIDPNRVMIDDWDDDYRAQVLAYVHAPAGDPRAGSILLRDLRTGRDYPVPSPLRINSRPILGYGKNRVAFLGADSAGGARGIYAMELGTGRLDTLVRDGGDALDIRWILGNNALLAAYGPEGGRDLHRIDPWSREVRNLTGGRFGDVTGFDVARSGDRLAVIGAADGRSTLWVTDLKLEEPLPVASDRGFVGSPRWNADGTRLAFAILGSGPAGEARTPAGEGPASAGEAPVSGGEAGASGELRVFDFRDNRLVPVTLQSRVRDFAWSSDGGRIFYVAGVNLLDINEYHLDSLVLRKATRGGGGGGSPRSEERPSPRMLGVRDGLLFEAASEGSRRILWMDLETREEKVLVDSAGFNSLR